MLLDNPLLAMIAGVFGGGISAMVFLDNRYARANHRHEELSELSANQRWIMDRLTAISRHLGIP